MFLTEYNQEKMLEQERKEVTEKVTKEVTEKVTKEVTETMNQRVAMDMLQDGEPLEKIRKYSRLSETAIRNLAKSVGVTVM